MTHLVSTGDLGLDVLLGGGLRLVTRLPGKVSATVVVRGGGGAGKTLVGLHVALMLAKALDGDVAVGCVEVLPSEYVEQVRAARADIDPRRVAVLPDAPSGSAPRVFCGLLTDLDPDAPDLVASLEALARDVMAAGGKPVVLVVDSLIEGYGIGTSVPRPSADEVMKFAAQGGYGVVLCEEARVAEPSPWVFAADTVVELGVEARERGRWIEVRKHRFGASVSGRHELDLGAGTPPSVFPEPRAWVARDAREVLHQHGWEYGNRSMPALVWDTLKASPVIPQDDVRLGGAFVVTTSPIWGVARSLAYDLRPAGELGPDLAIELDPLVTREAVPAEGSLSCHLPTVHGPARALRTLVEQFARLFDETRPQVPKARRVIVGDLEPVLFAEDALAWVEAVRVFASLVIESRWGIPVIAFATGAGGPSSVLSTYADLQIQGHHEAQVRAMLRWHRRLVMINLAPDVTSVRLALDDLPRPLGRKVDR
jgi:hypothetical protein